MAGLNQIWARKLSTTGNLAPSNLSQAVTGSRRLGIISVKLGPHSSDTIIKICDRLGSSSWNVTSADKNIVS